MRAEEAGRGRGGAGAARQPEGRAAQGRGSQAGRAAVSGRPGGESIYLAAPAAPLHRPPSPATAAVPPTSPGAPCAQGDGARPGAGPPRPTSATGAQCPLLAAAAHQSTSLTVVADGSPRPGYVPLLFSPRPAGGALPGNVGKPGEGVRPRSRRRTGRIRASGSGAGPRCWWRGEGKYRAAVRDTWPGLKAHRVFRCA